MTCFVVVLEFYEYEEPVKIIWTNIKKSKQTLNKKTFDKLIEIIRGHNHIEFSTTE